MKWGLLLAAYFIVGAVVAFAWDVWEMNKDIPFERMPTVPLYKIRTASVFAWVVFWFPLLVLAIIELFCPFVGD